jgi:hypothetical protein
VVVVYASITMAVAQFVMAPPVSSDGVLQSEEIKSATTQSEEIDSAQSATTPLRIIGRIAMGLRVLRVLVNMRKVNELRGSVATKLRTAVSQNKRRYQANGFDMDLTYITNRVIAMSAPALGDHAAYRNDCNVVSRFLSLQHYASFFIFNLCDTCISSDGVIGNYHPRMFFNQVQRIPFEDHCPPLLVELIQFCREASKWLSRDNTHIVNVHCKGGKGRTGVMIAALLLWSGHRKCALDAMELFAFRRTSNYDPEAGIDGDEDVDEGGKGIFDRKKEPNRGVDGPSQQRYLFYLEAMLYQGIQPLSASNVVLKSIQFPAGAAQEKKAWLLSFVIKCQRTVFHDSFGRNAARAVTFGGPGCTNKDSNCQMLTLQANLPIFQDTRIEMYRHKRPMDPKRKLLWFVVWHPAFYQGQNEIKFAKKKVDMLHKDSKCEKADANFTLTLRLSTDTSEPSVGNACDLKRLFKEFGEERTFKLGDDITGTEREITFITSGFAEAVIIEDERLMQQPHPLGVPIPEHIPGVGYAVGNMRTPIHTVLGEGNVLGVADFFASKHRLVFRARSEVKALVLRSRQSVENLLDLSHLSNDLFGLPNPLSPNGSMDCDPKTQNIPSHKPPGQTTKFGHFTPPDKAFKHQQVSNPSSNQNEKAEGIHSAPLESPTKRAWVVKKRLNVLQHDWRYTFSNVISIRTSDGKCTRALTFQSFCQVSGGGRD